MLAKLLLKCSLIHWRGMFSKKEGFRFSGLGRWNLNIVIIKAMTNIQWKGVHVVLPASTLQCADKGMCWDVDFQSNQAYDFAGQCKLKRWKLRHQFLSVC